MIKVEDPRRGDDTRRWGPPFQGGEASYFLSANRNKRGLAVDLKAPEGRLLAQQLAAASDIVIENFRPGTAARLGLGYEELSEQNPAAHLRLDQRLRADRAGLRAARLRRGRAGPVRRS